MDEERFIRNRLWFTGLSTQQLCHKLAVTNHRLSPCGGDAKCGYEKTTFKEKFANTEIKNIMLSLGSFITLVFSWIRQTILKLCSSVELEIGLGAFCIFEMKHKKIHFEMMLLLNYYYCFFYFFYCYFLLLNLTSIFKIQIFEFSNLILQGTLLHPR